MKALLISMLSITLISCSSEEVDDTHYTEGQVLKSSKEFTIPKELKDKINEKYIKYVRETEPSNIATDEELIAQLPREYLEVDMYLEELYTGSLIQNTVFRSPRGGGLVDLVDTVIGKKGSFFISFSARNPEAPEEKLDNLNIYYLSEVKKKQIEDKTYGTGCGSLIDITKSKDEKFRVNAKDNRYFHTMAGIYIFVNYAMEKIRLAALRVKNSSIEGYECLGKK